jgi:hypothetical protein
MSNLISFEEMSAFLDTIRQPGSGMSRLAGGRSGPHRIGRSSESLNISDIRSTSYSLQRSEILDEHHKRNHDVVSFHEHIHQVAPLRRGDSYTPTVTHSTPGDTLNMIRVHLRHSRIRSISGIFHTSTVPLIDLFEALLTLHVPGVTEEDIDALLVSIGREFQCKDASMFGGIPRDNLVEIFSSS